VSATRQIPDPGAVAWWLDSLKNPQGGRKPTPDPTDPAAVAAYNEARRQLATDCGGLNAYRLEAPDGTEPERTP
jgi:hypothetical protein